MKAQIVSGDAGGEADADHELEAPDSDVEKSPGIEINGTVDENKNPRDAYLVRLNNLNL